MQPKLQKTFQRVVMAYNPGKFPENYKPLDQVDDSQVNKSLWVHMFAGLRNPSITYGNHLKQLFLDDEIPSQKWGFPCILIFWGCPLLVALFAVGGVDMA